MIVITKDSEFEIAQLVCDRILALVKSKPSAVLGLATGSSPIPTYQKIIEAFKADKTDFSLVKTFNLDEYIDNPDHTQSYRHFMNVNLFDGINVNLGNTRFPDAESPESYDSEIELSGGIDLQLLGIGANGHIGFNEPGTPFDSKTHIVALTAKTLHDNARFFKSIDDVPSRAVTMGLSTIMQAKEIILIATGAAKAQAVRQMLDKPAENCPASVLSRHGDVTVYCDKAAASLL